MKCPALFAAKRKQSSKHSKTYELKSGGRRGPLENALRILDDLILSAPGTITSTAEGQLLVSAVALRLCLAPTLIRRF